MNTKSKQRDYPGRYWLLMGLFILGFLGLVGKIIQLHIVNSEFLQQQGDARAIRTMDISAYRGIISDRDGEPLAISTPVDTIWANPRKVLENPVDLSQLALLLERTPAQLQAQFTQHSDKSFIYLKRQIEPSLADAIEALALPGVERMHEYRRYYPDGEVSAHVVGFTNVDDVGQEGLELAYDDWLRGIPGKKRVVVDRMQHVIDDIDMVQEPVQGHSLTLSLDKRLQYLAYRELLSAVQRHDAVGGSIVILDVRTGEVLAMVNQPSFNPNNRLSLEPSHLRNRAVTDVFEPGSVIKAFSMAAALESGQFQPDTLIDTTPGVFDINGNTVRDIRNFGALDLTGIIQKSSNVGMSKVILDLEPHTVTRMMFNMGFGSITGSGFPGERIGKVVIPNENDKFSQATQSFGYGLSVTPLQLARAFAAIGNDGILRPVSFLRLDPNELQQGQRVLESDVAQEILLMLAQNTQIGGSGTRAQIEGYQVAGKTGTARKVGKQGYLSDSHRPVFAGLAPASMPRLAMVVMIDEPHTGGYYGGLVAAPVFAKVMAGALRLLNITPDDAASPMQSPLYIADNTATKVNHE